MTGAVEPWPPDDVDLASGRWLTVAQAAGVMRVSERTIRRWVSQGGIAVVTPGGRVWIDRRRLFQSMS